MNHRNTDRSDETLRRGIRDSTVTRAGQATGETVLVPSRNRWSRVGHITGQTGKVADDEMVVDGIVVAENRSNVRGAKEPCCNAVPVAVGEAGADDKDARQSARPEARGVYGKGKMEAEGVRVE